MSSMYVFKLFHRFCPISPVLHCSVYPGLGFRCLLRITPSLPHHVHSIASIWYPHSSFNLHLDPDGSVITCSMSTFLLQSPPRPWWLCHLFYVHIPPSISTSTPMALSSLVLCPHSSFNLHLDPDGSVVTCSMSTFLLQSSPRLWWLCHLFYVFAFTKGLPSYKWRGRNVLVAYCTIWSLYVRRWRNSNWISVLRTHFTPSSTWWQVIQSPGTRITNTCR